VSTGPVIRKLHDLEKYAIAPADTVKQVYLAGPRDGSPASVFYEVWDPAGEQPDNSHPGSAEIFLILSGRGVAYCDGAETEIEAGDVLVLPAGTVHRIRNTSPTERMYAVTVMADDAASMPGGFARLVLGGTPEPVDGTDIATVLSDPASSV
jgi:mannose-6-phosphate isomerase-like protein (cupin superfamily)